MTAERKLLMAAGDRRAMSRRRMRPGEPVAMPLAGAGVPVGSATKGGPALWHCRYAGRRAGAGRLSPAPAASVFT